MFSWFQEVTNLRIIFILSSRETVYTHLIFIVLYDLNSKELLLYKKHNFIFLLVDGFVDYGDNYFFKKKNFILKIVFAITSLYPTNQCLDWKRYLFYTIKKIYYLVDIVHIISP